VFTGIAMLVVSWLAAWRMRGGAAPGPGVLRALVVMTFSGWVATVAGWYVTEIGRQPWMVYGVLSVADSVGPIMAPMIGLSLTAYMTVYVVLLLAYISVLFYLARRAGEEA
jgi:cytochrome d ubiquinol oxidase subunit I